MDYIVEGKTYWLSYSELREKYTLISELTDEEFMSRLPEAIHLACIICYLKEIPSYICLSDRGIIHELAHLLHIPKENTTELKDIRKLFDVQLKLS